MPKPSSPRIKKILPLSPLQRFMLGLALRDDEGFVDPYVIQTWGRLEGQFEADSVRRIWERLTQRHAALRTAFVNQGKGEPRLCNLTDQGPATPLRPCQAAAAAPDVGTHRGAQLVLPYE